MFRWLFGKKIVVGTTEDRAFTFRNDFTTRDVTGYYTLYENTRNGKRSAKLTTDNSYMNTWFGDYISTDIMRWIDTGDKTEITCKVKWINE